MTGIALYTYQQSLHKVAEEFNEQPWDSFDMVKRLGKRGQRYVPNGWGSAEAAKRAVTNVSLDDLREFSFDEINKIKYSSTSMMDWTVTDFCEKKDPSYMLVHKISSSLWRWSFSRDTWNNVVDAYDAIRSFDLGLPDFEVFLDHTTGFNEQGYSEYSRTFLDGVFAYLVHYRGEHVMTIGFSVVENRRIVIQQIQLVKRQGNRFLFKMPQNRVEHVIGCFRAAFPRHELYLVDGHDVAFKSLKSYRSYKANATLRLSKLAERGEQTDWSRREGDALLADIVLYGERIKHLEGDLERLRAFYADTGRYSLGETLLLKELKHYAIAA